jgi:hypothetical protein
MSWLLVTVIAAAGTMVKPNFTLVLIPVVSLLVLIAWISKKPIQWSMYLALVLPGIIILGWQFISTYSVGGESSSQIIFAPLVSELSASGNLLPKFLLSIFFVWSVWVVTKGAFLQDRANQINGLTFLLSVGLLYLMAESGNRLEAGNFRWGAQITLFLFIVSISRYIWKKPELTRLEITGFVIGLGPQAISGLIYWLHCLTSKGYG